MSNLIEEVNKRLTKWDMQITIKDILQGILRKGRPALVISGGESIRDTIDKIKVDRPISEIEKDFRKYGILLIENSEKFPDYRRPNETQDGYYDCQDWTFDRVGLPHLTYREGGLKAYELLHNDLPGVNWISDPEINSVVLYFRYRGRFSPAKVEHWGVVSNLDGDIKVQSKWGKGHVYEHPLGMVPIYLGNCIYFFRPKLMTK